MPRLILQGNKLLDRRHLPEVSVRLRMLAGQMYLISRCMAEEPIQVALLQANSSSDRQRMTTSHRQCPDETTKTAASGTPGSSAGYVSDLAAIIRMIGRTRSAAAIQQTEFLCLRPASQRMRAQNVLAATRSLGVREGRNNRRGSSNSSRKWQIRIWIALRSIKGHRVLVPGNLCLSKVNRSRYSTFKPQRRGKGCSVAVEVALVALYQIKTLLQTG
jgi:hypothetical protein